MEDTLHQAVFALWWPVLQYILINLTYVKAVMERILANPLEHAPTLSFSSMEVQEAIKSLPLGKAAGPEIV